MKSARYSQNFKLAAVAKVIVDGQSISGTARKEGITVVTLRSWIDKFSSLVGGTESTLSEVEILKRRLQEVIAERDTLKATLLIVLRDQAKTVD
jgi:transposase-like protein